MHTMRPTLASLFVGLLVTSGCWIATDAGSIRSRRNSGIDAPVGSDDQTTPISTTLFYSAVGGRQESNDFTTNWIPVTEATTIGWVPSTTYPETVEKSTESFTPVSEWTPILQPEVQQEPAGLRSIDEGVLYYQSINLAAPVGYQQPQPAYEPPQPAYEPPQQAPESYPPPQSPYEPPQPAYEPPQPAYEPPQLAPESYPPPQSPYEPVQYPSQDYAPAGPVYEPVQPATETYAPAGPVYEPVTYAPAGPVYEPVTYAPAGPVYEPVTYAPAGPVYEPVTYAPAGPVYEPVTYAPAGPVYEPVQPAPETYPSTGPVPKTYYQQAAGRSPEFDGIANSEFWKLVPVPATAKGSAKATAGPTVLCNWGIQKYGCDDPFNNQVFPKWPVFSNKFRSLKQF